MPHMLTGVRCEEASACPKTKSWNMTINCSVDWCRLLVIRPGVTPHHQTQKGSSTFLRPWSGRRREMKVLEYDYKLLS